MSFPSYSAFEPFVVTIQKAVFTESLPFVYLLWHLPAFLSIIFFKNDAV